VVVRGADCILAIFRVKPSLEHSRRVRRTADAYDGNEEGGNRREGDHSRRAERGGHTDTGGGGGGGEVSPNE
jgi:hypothetical protein